jgi:hypothetical protein
MLQDNFHGVLSPGYDSVFFSLAILLFCGGAAFDNFQFSIKAAAVQCLFARRRRTAGKFFRGSFLCRRVVVAWKQSKDGRSGGYEDPFDGL